MSYKLLAQHLHTTADQAMAFFKRELGAKAFRIEETIDDLPLKPTLHAMLNNGCVLCVEVSESAYSNSLDTFVVECSSQSYPVKLYVAIPSAKGDQDFATNLKKAKDRGVGVVELHDDNPFIAADAVSLSLFGLRKNNLSEFPKQKREAVKQAEQTFLNGNPVKGCQALYEELEALTRAFAQRSKSEGWWRSPHNGENGPKARLDTGAWANVLEELSRFIDIKNCKKKCPEMKDSLIASVRGLTDPRNLTSHKPTQLAKTIERDRQLRTWFESTSECLKAWYKATRPLRI
jgi:hypothetical protein